MPKVDYLVSMLGLKCRKLTIFVFFSTYFIQKVDDYYFVQYPASAKGEALLSPLPLLCWYQSFLRKLVYWVIYGSG